VKNTTLFLTAVFMAIVASQILAMNIYDDPRTIFSYKDKQLAPEVDIMHVATKISGNDQLVFQVKTRGERETGETSDYVLLKIRHDQTFALIIPVNRASEQKALLYQSSTQTEPTGQTQLPRKFDQLISDTGFTARHIDNGIEFLIPIDWINFGTLLSYDAYTIQANSDGHQLYINKIYDQARKGREEKLFPAFTLLNKLCSPKR
jgi:hypothetical protein